MIAFVKDRRLVAEVAAAQQMTMMTTPFQLYVLLEAITSSLRPIWPSSEIDFSTSGYQSGTSPRVVQFFCLACHSLARGDFPGFTDAGEARGSETPSPLSSVCPSTIPPNI